MDLLERMLLAPVKRPTSAAAPSPEAAELAAQLAAVTEERDRLLARAGQHDGRPASWLRAVFGLVEAMPPGLLELDYKVLNELGADIQRRVHPVLEQYNLLGYQAQAERDRSAAAAYRDRLRAQNEFSIAYMAVEYPGAELPELNAVGPEPAEPMNGDSMDSQAGAPSEAPSPDLATDPAIPKKR